VHAANRFTVVVIKQNSAQKILAGLALAGALTLGIVWGGDSAPIQKAVSAVTENIQKPGHLAFADVVYIQKPGH
jgi:hypothetical protein